MNHFLSAKARSTFMTVLILSLGACEVSGGGGADGDGGGSAPKIREPSSNKLVQLNRTKTISGTFDCDGATYRWTGPGDCSQKEGMPPMFVLRAGATLRNCFIEGAPDGIHLRGSNIKIENIVMADVCDDAISAPKNANYDNIEITDSQFAKCEDKCLQFNPRSVKKVLIKNNDFVDATRCIRFKGGSDLIVEDNVFYKCKEALRHSEGSAKLRVKGNKFIGVKHKVRKTSGLSISGDL